MKQGWRWAVALLALALAGGWLEWARKRELTAAWGIVAVMGLLAVYGLLVPSKA